MLTYVTFDTGSTIAKTPYITTVCTVIHRATYTNSNSVTVSQ